MNITISFKTLFFIVIGVSITTLIGLWIYRNWWSSDRQITTPEFATGLAPHDPRMRRYTSPSPFYTPSKEDVSYVLQSESALFAADNSAVGGGGAGGAGGAGGWMKALLVALGLARVEDLIDGSSRNNNSSSSSAMKRFLRRSTGTHSVQAECALAAEEEPPSEDVAAAGGGSGEERRKKRNRSSQFQEMGIRVLKDILKDHGGNPEALKENARVKGVVNPSSGRLLEFDALYTEGDHSIAVEFQGSQHSQYPNAYHRSRREFTLQQERDAAKAEAAERLGIFLIAVPHHVERCVSDPDEPSGWRFDPTVTEPERYRRLRIYIESEMVRYYTQMMGYAAGVGG